MTNVQIRSKWAVCKTLLLALPLLILGFAATPRAQADEHHGFYRRHGYQRAPHGRGYGRDRAIDHGYYHGGRSYRHRRYYSRGGRRYYRYYDSSPRSGVIVNIPL